MKMKWTDSKLRLVVTLLANAGYQVPNGRPKVNEPVYAIVAADVGQDCTPNAVYHVIAHIHHVHNGPYNLGGSRSARPLISEQQYLKGLKVCAMAFQAGILNAHQYAAQQELYHKSYYE